MSEEPEDPSALYTPAEWGRAHALGLDEATTHAVAQLLGATRRALEAAWVARVDRAVEAQRELRAQRDVAEARAARVEAVAQVPSYLNPAKLVPRFTMTGKEVLRALRGEP